jgi:hypothetical protein
MTKPSHPINARRADPWSSFLEAVLREAVAVVAFEVRAGETQSPSHHERRAVLQRQIAFMLEAGQHAAQSRRDGYRWSSGDTV